MEITKTSRGITKAQEVEPIKNVKDIAKIKQYEYYGFREPVFR